MRTEDRWLGAEAIPIGLEPYEVEHFFRLSEAEWAAVTDRRGALVQLGLALQVRFLRLSGRLLNSAELVPRPVLAYVADQLQVGVPDLASLRSLYTRKPTLHAHQQDAMRLLERTRPTEATFGKLTAHLRREAVTAFEADELVPSAMRWMVRNGFVLPGQRRLEDACRAAIAHRQDEMAEAIRRAVPDLDSGDWIEALTAQVPGEPVTLHEHLRRVPPGRSVTGLEAQAAKVRTLCALGADRLVLPDVPVAIMRRYAARAAERPPRKLSRVREPARTIEIAWPATCAASSSSSPTRPPAWRTTGSRRPGARRTRRRGRARRRCWTATGGSSASWRRHGPIRTRATKSLDGSPGSCSPPSRTSRSATGPRVPAERSPSDTARSAASSGRSGPWS